MLVPTFLTVAFVAGVGWLLHLLASALVGLLGYHLQALWEGLGGRLGVDDAWLRLMLYGLVHVALYVQLWPIADRATRWGRPRWRKLVRSWRRIRHEPLARFFSTGARVFAVLFLVVVVGQPTVVPLSIGGRAWLHRVANLVDGTAIAAVVDSAAGLVYWLRGPEPIPPVETVGADAFGIDLDAPSVPLMDRWDDELWRAVEGDPHHFAMTKAVMWVESGGRQYALSSTGCAGLMQFCASTAQRRPFQAIFGIGRVKTCGCRDCSVDKDVQIALETDPGAIVEYQERFPCDLADARFDAERSIRAGAAFVDELSAEVGGHLLLIYVGYQAGPRVAHALYATLGEPDEVTIDDLRPHLAAALRPYHGRGAEGRARGLLDVHLPKLQRAYARWLASD